MKILTTNFLTCAVKACKASPASFPLRFRDATLERSEIDYNPLFVRNILPRIQWDALKGTAAELGLSAMVPDQNPLDVASGEEDAKENDNNQDMDLDDEQNQHEPEPPQNADEEEEKEIQIDDQVLKQLHTLLLETAVVEGKLVCGNCGFEYPIKEGVGNFLLPAHLV